MANFQCENYCCSASTIPLRVCKAITRHKFQGLSIGIGKDWDTVVVTLPTKHIKTHSGMELVELSRYTLKESFTIRDDGVNGVTVEDLNSIG